jgi:RHS repeat-associated protein
LLTETLPAPTPGAVRPQTRFQYAQFQAYFRNSGGSIIASGVPTWLQTGSSRCQTLTSCAGSADEAKTTTDYGPQIAGTANNLLPVASAVAAGDNSLTATTASTYDANGWRLTVDGPLPGTTDTTRFRYDVVGRVIGVVGPDSDGGGPRPNLAVRTTYNAIGQPTLVERGTVAGQSDAAWDAFSSLQQLGIGYDAAGREAVETRASGGTTFAVSQFSYDAAGRAECVAARMNPATFNSLPASACSLGTAGSYGPDRIVKRLYDLAGRLQQVRSALGTADESADETRTYASNDLVETVADGEGNLTTYDYDGLNRLRMTRFPVAAQGAGTSSTSDYERLFYDAAGNISSRQLRDGRSIAFTYDALGRPTLKDLPGSDPDVAYSYDNLGRLTSALFSATGQGVTNSYDALGRLTSTSTVISGTVRTLSYQYDLAGNRIRITHPDGTFFTYGRDILGRVTLVREGGVNWLNGFSFTDLGQVSDQSYNATFVSSYGYDAIGRVSAMSHNLPGTSQDVSFSFGYSPANQIAWRTQSNDAYAWGGHYAVNRPYTTNGLNQHTAAGSVNFIYDTNGNLNSDGSRTFTYDSENRLVGASGGVQLGYDPLGRLAWTTGNPNFTQFVYDGDALVAEYDYSGNLTRRYVQGSGVDTPEVAYDYVGGTLSATRFLIADERGSIVALADANGAPATINTYDEYGIPGSANTGRFQYTGQTWLPELGMYYYKARMYSPTLGRFMQTGPVGYRDGMNMYAYVQDDPVNGSDPTGLLCRWRYADGTCRVKLPRNATDDERAAGRLLEGRLNKWDSIVRGLPDNARIAVYNQNGSQTGTITGSEYRRLWNDIGTSIVPNGTITDNGGAGGGTSYFRGVRLEPQAIDSYQRSAVALHPERSPDRAREDAVDTILFHEFGHATEWGRRISSRHPAHQRPWHDADETREARTSNIGRAMLGTIGGTYVCELTHCE